MDGATGTVSNMGLELGPDFAPSDLRIDGAYSERHTSPRYYAFGAEADIRSNDRDGNKVQDFWTADVSGLFHGNYSGDFNTMTGGWGGDHDGFWQWGKHDDGQPNSMRLGSVSHLEEKINHLSNMGV